MSPNQIPTTESSTPPTDGELSRTVPCNLWNGSIMNLNPKRLERLLSTSTEPPNQWSMMLQYTKLESSRISVKWLKISPNGLSQDPSAIQINSPHASPTRTEPSPLIHQPKLSWEDVPNQPTAPLTSMNKLEATNSRNSENTPKKLETP
jgi:hypothetical protein